MAAAVAVVALGVAGVFALSGDDDGGDWPSGTVEMYVGADPGGSSDLISRAVSQGLSEALGESFPVINKSGSNGALAAAEVGMFEDDDRLLSGPQGRLLDAMLAAMGLDADAAARTVRFSLGRPTTEAAMNTAAEAVVDAVCSLRRRAAAA